MWSLTFKPPRCRHGVVFKQLRNNKISDLRVNRGSIFLDVGKTETCH
jgi:hypothetical protein